MPNTIDATLSDATGPVFVERDGNRIALNEGDGIYESDVIITGSETTADIVFRDGTKSRLSPDTELKLIDFDFGAGEEPSFVMGLAQGALRTVSGEVVKLNPEAFELITPRATVGIRGTEFFNSVDGENETHAVLYIADGHIMMVTRSDGQSINLSAPLQLIDIRGENSGKLNIQEFSLSEMAQTVNALAPSLGGNFPQSESEQGDWEKLASTDAVLDKEEEADAKAAEKVSEEASNAESVSEVISHTTTSMIATAAVKVIIVDQNDPNNGILLDALGQAGIAVDIINAGTSDENLDNVDDVDDSLIAENDATGDIRPIEPSFPDTETVTQDPDNIIIISGHVMGEDNVVIGDAHTINVQGRHVFGSDSITIAGNVGGKAVVAGDSYDVDAKNSAKLIFGSDRITIAGNVTGDDTVVTGDAYEVNAKSSTKLTFGNDTITISGNVNNDAIVTGDAYEMDVKNSTTVIFGDDTITITGTVGEGEIYGDYAGDDLGSRPNVTFGNDTIIVGALASGGTIYGDSDDTDSSNGGNDIITVQGDLTVTHGGTTSIYGGGGNDTITIEGTIRPTGAREVKIDGGAGNDTIILNQFIGTGTELTGGAGVDNFTFNLGSVLGDAYGAVTFTDFNEGGEDGNITLTSPVLVHSFAASTGNPDDLSISIVINGETKHFIFEDLIDTYGNAQNAYNSISGQLVGFGSLV